MRFEHVAVIGTGLIGASLGHAIRQLRPAPHVVGFDADHESARKAARERAVDTVAGSLAEAVRAADLIILSIPVRALQPVMRELGPLLASGAIVTDTGSTKREVLTWAEEHLPSGVGFVGGHPMAGRLTNDSSPETFVSFANTTYCLTPSARSEGGAVQAVAELVEAIGAHPYFLDADEHDSLVAAVSHLPYIVSSALVSSLVTDASWREMARLAAGGFATATRLVEGSPRVFADICHTNRRHLARRITQLIEELERVRQEIESGDERLGARFEQAQQERALWLATRGQEPTTPPTGSREDLRGLFLPRWRSGERDKG